MIASSPARPPVGAAPEQAPLPQSAPAPPPAEPAPATAHFDYPALEEMDPSLGEPS